MHIQTVYMINAEKESRLTKSKPIRIICVFVCLCLCVLVWICYVYAYKTYLWAEYNIRYGTFTAVKVHIQLVQADFLVYKRAKITME